MTRQYLRGAILLALLVLPAGAWAQGPPPGNPSLNARVTALEAAVAELMSRVSSLETDLAAANATIGALQSDVDAVKSNSVLALDGKLSLGDLEGDGLPDAVFEGVNVQIANGLGSTRTMNGTGNLIIGYNEPRPEWYPASCSIASFETDRECVENGGVWAVNHRNGSHNLVIGQLHAYAGTVGLVAGHDNMVTGLYASVGGGNFNVAGSSASVSGGIANRAIGGHATVGGGEFNIARGYSAFVSGGRGNTANGRASTVCGGSNNTAGEHTWTGNFASVSGGYSNTADGGYSTVSGGSSLWASAPYSHVAPPQ